SGVMETKNDQALLGVQNYLQEAAQKLKPSAPIKFHISSRTDSGVHALANAAHLDIQRPPGKAPFAGQHLVQCLNHHLRPEPIRWDSSHLLQMIFWCHALPFLVKCLGAFFFPPFDLQIQALLGSPLNIPAMRAAAEFLLGTHDFSTFRSLHSENASQSPVRTLLQLQIQPAPGFLSHHYQHRELEFWEVKVKSRAFLYRQVRRMVGALVAVGQGKLAPEHIQELLELKDSRAFPPYAMAPASGLFLKSVEY
ncbi:PUSL1 protein, partial [Erythrocercus mccallii]|nr:PUSL1 protein [Erythrocercus mccallii]